MYNIHDASEKLSTTHTLTESCETWSHRRRVLFLWMKYFQAHFTRAYSRFSFLVPSKMNWFCMWILNTHKTVSKLSWSTHRLCQSTHIFHMLDFFLSFNPLGITKYVNNEKLLCVMYYIWLHAPYFLSMHHTPYAPRSVLSTFSIIGNPYNST